MKNKEGLLLKWNPADQVWSDGILSLSVFLSPVTLPSPLSLSLPPCPLSPLTLSHPLSYNRLLLTHAVHFLFILLSIPLYFVLGSIQSDLPMQRLAEMFNVNHFIVSQVRIAVLISQFIYFSNRCTILSFLLLLSVSDADELRFGCSISFFVSFHRLFFLASSFSLSLFLSFFFSLTRLIPTWPQS